MVGVHDMENGNIGERTRSVTAGETPFLGGLYPLKLKLWQGIYKPPRFPNRQVDQEQDWK